MRRVLGLLLVVAATMATAPPKVSSKETPTTAAAVPKVSKKVRSRYEALPYPTQDDMKAMWVQLKDGPAWLQKTTKVLFDNRFDFCATPMRIMVAGCGTGVQMVTAVSGLLAATSVCDAGAAGKGWEVVCLDLSDASLKIAKTKAQLSGYVGSGGTVTFVQGDILELEASQVGGVFDVITSIGVLHHIHDTGLALRKLQGLLRQGGGMEIMLYSFHGRAVQDLFRAQQAIKLVTGASARHHRDRRRRQDTRGGGGGNRMSDDEASDRDEETTLRLAGRVLDSLPDNHPHIHINGRGGDGRHWEGLADRYLHPHERTFTPLDIFKMAESLTADGYARPEDTGDVCSAAFDDIGGASSAAHSHGGSSGEQQQVDGLTTTTGHMTVEWANPSHYDPTRFFAPGLIPDTGARSSSSSSSSSSGRGRGSSLYDGEEDDDDDEEEDGEVANGGIAASASSGAKVSAEQAEADAAEEAGSLVAGVFTPAEAAQLAVLASPGPPQNLEFYYKCPPHLRVERLSTASTHDDIVGSHTGSSVGDQSNAWKVTGRIRGKVDPFGPAEVIDLTQIGALNARSYRQNGLNDVAQAIVDEAKRAQQKQEEDMVETQSRFRP